MHNERSEECIIHEPIVHHELTDLIHGFKTVICNKRDLHPIRLVTWFGRKINNEDLVFCLLVEYIVPH